MWILIVCLTISIIINVVFYILLNKSTNISLEFEHNITQLEKWISDFQKMMYETYIHLKNIDNSGIFEKDDSVGFVFSDIVNIITECNERINTYNKEKSNNEEEIDKSSSSDDYNESEQKPKVEVKKSEPYFNNIDRDQISQYLQKKQQSSDI